MSTTAISQPTAPPADVDLPSTPLDASGRSRMARNVLASWGGHAVFVIAGFLMPRLIDAHLGQVSLGLWDFAWSVVSYFVIAQVGVGSSVNRYVAKHRSVGDIESLNRSVSSVNLIQLASTALTLVVTALLMWLLPVLFDQHGVEPTEARWVIGLLGCSVATQMAFNAFSGVLTGCHRWDIHNGVTAGSYGGIVVGMIAALLLGGGLAALAAVYFVGTIAGEFVRMRLAFRACPELRVSPRFATWQEVKTLLAFGGKTVVDNLSRLLLAQANAILVASYLGPGALAVYARPGALMRHADTLASKFGMVLTPAASSLKGSKSTDEIRQLFIDATRFAACLAMPITVFMTLMGDVILHVWMGPAYREGQLMVVMALGTALPLVARPAGHMMIGLNAHGRIGWASFAIAWPGIAAAVLALGYMGGGLVSAALALVIPYSIGNGVFVLVYACRQLKVPVSEMCRRAFVLPLVCAVPLVAALIPVQAVETQSPVASLLLGLVVSAAIVGPLYWRFMLTADMRQKVLRKLSRSAAVMNTEPGAPARQVPRVVEISKRGESAEPVPATLRPLPYPYVAALAICSDLDETPDRHVYEASARFLNTTEQTSMGRGVGLEVGNTIYFDMPPGQFAYWNTDDAGRHVVRTLIRSGHIDCLHSFGDLATTRHHAARALDELVRFDCRLEVWVDHATAITNFDGDIMRGEGDQPGSAAYHADLTCAAGVKFVWRGRVTSVIGQNTSRRLGGIWAPAHPYKATRTLAKEMAKGALARMGQQKYAMHGPNAVLRPALLRDGQPVHEFLRSNPHWQGVNRGETATGFGEVVSAAMLERLISRESVSVLYTHLGKIRDRQRPFDERACDAFRRMADHYHEGRLLVATTRRILGYVHMQARARATIRQVNGCSEVHITTAGDANDEGADYSGLTVYVPDVDGARLFVDSREVTTLIRNPPDRSGRCSVSVPWRRLQFPQF